MNNITQTVFVKCLAVFILLFVSYMIGFQRGYEKGREDRD